MQTRSVGSFISLRSVSRVARDLEASYSILEMQQLQISVLAKRYISQRRDVLTHKYEGGKLDNRSS